MRMYRFMIGLSLACTMMATAQQSVFPVERQSYLRTDICYQMWRIEGSQFVVSQLSFPLMLYVPFSDKLSMTVTHVPAYSQWGSDYTVKGLSDTWIQGTYLSGNERWTLNLGMGVPTGKTRLTNNQLFFTQYILSQNVYNFRLPMYGQGFCLKAGGAFAYPITQKIVLGIGGQYLMRTAYHPASYTYDFRSQGRNTVKETDVKYKPGNELTAQAGLDYSAGENIKFMLDVMYTRYERDVLEKEEIYGSGEKIAVMGGMYYQYNEQYVWVFFTDRLKGKFELLRGLSFEQAEKNLTGAQLDVGVVWKAINFREGMFYILGDGRFYERNQNEKAGATVYGGGFALDIKLSAKTVMNARIKYMAGSLKDAELTRNAEGMELGGGLQFSL